jgi:aromatic-L-amino-acid decarboxylase
MAGRSDLPRLRVYCSGHAHSSVDKAALALGLGLENVVKIADDEQFRMRPDALSATIAEDRANGFLPLACVATVGTTSMTSIDPVPAIAEICRREQVWLHVDGAYGGTLAIASEFRYVLDGVEAADSLVVNPHKWLFTPLDLSAFYCRRMDVVRQAFSLTPAYLETPEGSARNLMDTGVQLGRRFRALKLWMMLKSFGSDAIRDRLALHMEIARACATWIDEDPDFERLAPVPLSVVCFRWNPRRGMLTDEALDMANEQILNAVNASGEVFLSHTRVRGRYALRIAVVHLNTTEAHVRRAWTLIREAAATR